MACAAVIAPCSSYETRTMLLTASSPPALNGTTWRTSMLEVNLREATPLQKIVPNVQVSFNLLRGNMLGAVDLTVFDQARKLVAAAHEDAIVSTAKSFAKRPRLQQLPKCRGQIAGNASSSAGILKKFIVSAPACDGRFRLPRGRLRRALRTRAFSEGA